MTKEFLEACLAEGLSLDQIAARAGRHPSTVSHYLRKHGLAALGMSKHSPRGGIEAEDLVPLADAGMSIRQMAREFDRSPSTIRYWLDRHGIDREGRGAGRPRMHGSESDQERSIISSCSRHGQTEFGLRADGYYRCRACSVEAVARRRRRVRRILVSEAGGKCALCGYNATVSALQFHHFDPKTKSFGLSARGVTRSLEKLRDEARKCILLCANCHAAVESGELDLPADLTAGNLRSKAA